ncbi:hypothetical protein [Dyella acidisoli]|nr:hypothetical protein [Dyella acidisoli]
MKTTKYKDEVKRQRLRVEAVTGEWYCQSSLHLVRGPIFHHRGRRLCGACHARMVAVTQKKKGSSCVK